MAAELWEWITPEGTIYRLDSFIDGAAIVETVTGRRMPPIRRTADGVPLQPGTRRRSAIHDENEQAYGVLFSGSTDVDLRANIRSWCQRLDPSRGDGRLRVTGPAGDVRELTCSYQDGLRGDEPAGQRQDEVAIVTWVASDPYWAAPAATVISWQTGVARSFFPILPLHLGSSQVFARSLLDPVSDVPTFPVWTISGPGASIALKNLTTGRTLSWSGSLGFGEQLTIDTRPGNQTNAPKSVFLQDATNQYGLLTARDMWPLKPGTNDVAIEMTGATEDSLVTLSYQSRYLSA